MRGGFDARGPGTAGRGGWDAGPPQSGFGATASFSPNVTDDILRGAVNVDRQIPDFAQPFGGQQKGGSGGAEQPMRVGDWICAGCFSFQFKKNQTCRKCGRSQESCVGPHVKRAAQSIADIQVDGPPWKKAKMPFLPPGLCIRNGMVCVDKPPQFVKLINIPSDERGGLIGKKGIVIEEIRKATKAYIKVECEKGDEFAVITIKGKQEEVEAAELAVQAKLSELNMPGIKHEEKLVVVPKDYIGETIGPGGRNLISISEKTDCKVKFVEASLFDETAAPDMQVCYIKGPPEKLPLAEHMLSERVAEVKRIHDEKEAAERGIVAGLGVAGRGAPTIPCKFHMRKAGSCKNGNDCYFSHDPAVISGAKGLENVEHNPEDYKMTYCKFWDSGQCTRGKACPFAHGIEELRGELNGRNMHIMSEAKQLADNKWQQMEVQNREEAKASVPAAFRTMAFKQKVGGDVHAAPKANAVPAAFRTNSFQQNWVSSGSAATADWGMNNIDWSDWAGW